MSWDWLKDVDKAPEDWTPKVMVRGKLQWRCPRHKGKYTWPCPICMGHWT